MWTTTDHDAVIESGLIGRHIMPFFEVLVQPESGHAATKRRVRLGGSHGLSSDEYTDSHGRAVLEFSASEATLYVEGKDKGRVRAGKNVVTIR